jgi:hypothetical protein
MFVILTLSAAGKSIYAQIMPKKSAGSAKTEGAFYFFAQDGVFFFL